MDPGQKLALALVAANTAVERRLDRHLGSIRGVSLAEYRLLRALADAPRTRASRVDLAGLVGLTPSGVTRALRPLEKFGYVATIKNERDARLALATLTAAGAELVDDASGVVDDAMASVLERKPLLVENYTKLLALLSELAHA
ncbi:MAG: MarR family transcriptional regulator [Actinomycetota bacterium]|nr:MarR family transcriptional regulator [Actinomycetota bacterium]